ncbi:MAG: ATP-binding protein, partial [Candidatus Sumerlaeota bacterium]|nr:ATP-binding protein [Candidatus Sumerlaeota bacterium]
RTKTFTILEKYFKDAFLPFSVSDGMLRFLAFLCLAYSDTSPSVVFIEEPENGVHPRRLKDIVDILTAISNPDIENPRQILIATHSPYLLDLVKPENVFIVEKKEGRSEIRSLDRTKKLEDQLMDFNLGELWYRGSIGGVR